MKNFAITTITAGTLAAAALGMAGAAAAAPTGPSSVAAPASLSCIDAGQATQCGSPGNVQITANTPPVQYQPLYPYFLIGGHHR
ncbi:MAG: hypothetical protein JWR37_2248 [Mycobacterium sp.]|jgi:hypothetical protein|nr:hypothetical protein [Mycobacterium sp.]